MKHLLAPLADGQWHLCRDLCAHFGLNYGNYRNAIRALPEWDNGEIIFGQKGFKLTRFATSEEITVALADLRSRSSSLADRARAISAAAYAAV